jgi:hypothetical protein
MILCVLGFQLVMFKNFFKRVIALVFGSSVITQLLLYSFGGQQLMNKSLEVFDEKMKFDRDYVVVMLRSQKPCKISSLIFEASLPTFMTIMSNAGSLITFLKSFVE